MEPVCVRHGSAYFGETAYWEEGEEVTVLELTGSLDSDNNILTAEFKKKDYSGDNKWAVIRNFDELSDGMEVTFDGGCLQRIFFQLSESGRGASCSRPLYGRCRH